MKILVAVKRVVDHNVPVRAKLDGSDVELDGVRMNINPFDEIAVEEALRLKEKGVATEIVAVSLGSAASPEALRHALAMGVDRALTVETGGVFLQPLAVAKLLKAIVEREQPGLVLVGKQAIDNDAGQAGQMLAAMLDWPQATFASELKIAGNEAIVTREVDGGVETIALALPAVVTCDLRLNAPRFVKLPNLMMAKKKAIEVLDAAETGVDVTPRIKRLKVAAPEQRKAGVKVANVAELVEKLRASGVL